VLVDRLGVLARLVDVFGVEELPAVRSSLLCASEIVLDRNIPITTQNIDKLSFRMGFPPNGEETESY